MASKLKIDNQKVDSIAPSRNSTPSVNGNAEASGSGSASGGMGAFKGQGQSLSGKKSKGKKDRTVEPLDPFSMIRRTDLPKVMTNDTQIGDKKVPAKLDLPFGKLYFGYDYVPLGGSKKEGTDGDQATGQQRIVFSGAGQTLSGRAPKQRRPKKEEEAETGGAAPTGGVASPAPPSEDQPFAGQGHTLGSNRVSRKRERGGGMTKKPTQEAIVIDDSD